MQQWLRLIIDVTHRLGAGASMLALTGKASFDTPAKCVDKAVDNFVDCFLNYADFEYLPSLAKFWAGIAKAT